MRTNTTIPFILLLKLLSIQIVQTQLQTEGPQRQGPPEGLHQGQIVQTQGQTQLQTEGRVAAMESVAAASKSMY